VLAGLPQGVGEPLVLGKGLLELPLGLEQPLLEGPHPFGRISEAPAEGAHLFFERLYALFR